MTRPLARRAGTQAVATLLALLLGAALVAGPSLADPFGKADPTPASRTAVDAARAVTRASAGEINLILRGLDPLEGRRQAALRSSGDRAHLRLALVATASALASMLVALAAAGRARTANAPSRRRLALAPVGARAPPVALPA